MSTASLTKSAARRLAGREAPELITVPAQLLFREVNEQIRLRANPGRDEAEFVCECDERTCSRHLRLPIEAYDALRQFPTRFVVSPEHIALSDERVVEEYDTYAIVEKTGPTAGIAIRLDPRRFHEASLWAA
jgi:hypothetical protein